MFSGVGAEGDVDLVKVLPNEYRGGSERGGSMERNDYIN